MGDPQQAVFATGDRRALRVLAGAGRFDAIAAGHGGRGRFGIALSAWLRKEALLLRERSDSEGAEASAESTSRVESKPGGETMPRIVGYDLQRQIGRGGSATVYLARELKHDRLVALKVLHPALVASLQAERFLREISIVAKLGHPNILPLLDSGTAGDVLYYVTPYVAGESLRTVIERNGALPVNQAVRLAREAAGALDHAHRQGIIHRDVKPENILLSDGHALVSDFGIARALSLSVDDRLTTFGVTPGTPRYMSPEQASGEADLRPASDVYSLGCVLYEMLTGAPPFIGTTPTETVAKHMGAPVPSLRPRRGVTPGLERAVLKALSKSPDARYVSAAAFEAALGDPANLTLVDLVRGWRGQRRARGLLTLAGVAAGAVALVRLSTTSDMLPLSTRILVALGSHTVRLDTAAYLAVGTGDAGLAVVDAVTTGMRNALDRWRDVTVTDDSIARAMVQRSYGAEFARAARRAAYRLEAGRFVVLTAMTAADSTRVSATLRDTRTGQTLASTESHLSVGASDVAAEVLRLSDELLFRVGPAARIVGMPGTASLAARQLYLAGHAALANGDFVAADSAFSAATTVDPEYPHALVWLANVRSWARGRSGWQALLPRAIGRRSALGSADSLLLEGLISMGAGDLGAACPRWVRLTEIASSDFAAWYGLGNCLRADNIVVRDPRVQGGWRFRSSKHQSVRAYEQAFRLRPNVLLGFGRSLTALHQIMLTSGSFVLIGPAASPDTLQFNGYRVWQGDSLAMIPLHGAQVLRFTGSAAMDEAVQQQRLRFRDVALLWKATYPRNADAIEAVAIALEMLGDEAALDTLQRARSLATDPEDRLRMAVNAVLMLVKFSTPRNPARLLRGRELADSLLAAHPPGSGVDGERLAALAALTGRANLAAAYARLGAGDETLPALARNGPALIAFAALGGPQDSLSALEAVVRNAVQSLPVSQRAAARRDWLTRAAVLGFPSGHLRTLAESDSTGLRLGNVIVRALARDSAEVMARLAEIAGARRWVRPADITTDGIFPEAAALAAVGAPDTAIARLDPTLQSLQFTASEDLSFVYRTGPLVRAMALRANLAAGQGDSPTARMWAATVLTLWTNADAFLNPVVARMRQLAP